MKQLYSLLATLLLGVHGAFAAIVLEVDISDPSAVVITATGEAASVSGSLGKFENGVILWEFFSGTNSVLNSGSGDLTIGYGTTTRRFDDYFKRTDKGLLLYDYNGVEPLAFSTTAPAFVGSSVFNFSSFSAQLPSVGSIGAVVSWDEDETIGQYIVVPEPSLALLGVAGFAAFALVRLRSRKNS